MGEERRRNDAERGHLHVKNVEAQRKAKRDYKKRHREKVLAAERERRRRPAVKARRNAYLRETGQGARAVEKRRAVKMGLTEHFTLDEWNALTAACAGRCLACGKRRKLTVDHIIPLSLGGPDTIDNIQPLCQSCNARKGVRTTDYRDGDKCEIPQRELVPA